MDRSSACPKCGFQPAAATDACPRCGVVFAKLTAPRTRPAPESAPIAPPSLTGARCQVCGPGPVAPIVLRRNIGAFIARFEQTVDGRLCRGCATRIFWSYTLTTAAVGWLGVMSLVIAPVYVVANIVAYVRAQGLRRPSPTDAMTPY